MASSKSLLLVVDASVAQASGETDHPISKSCREVLLDIKEICHHIIMTSAILKEWRRHESKFSRKWRSSMVARRKVKNVKDASFTIDTATIISLNDREKEALHKDAHLFEGAFDGDGIIISIDDEAARIWDKCHKHIQVPKAIKWINPLKWNDFSP